MSYQSFHINLCFQCFLPKLDHRFIRIHHSYIINKDQITAYTKNDIDAF
ncbi:LytTR family transcriptional regulator DNA-binding domain-containing protein [Tenacibaculum aiptasiae]|nr:LytTR family transcriptional regulator DNA-binding domain-containing protein [Tenacibaculum aiptasiae]